jgi:hypothetical protein
MADQVNTVPFDLGTNRSPSSEISTEKSHSDGKKQQRKRIRVPTSCSICRKRKIKCDKLKPVCSGCAKSNLVHLCQYEEPSWVSPVDTKKAKVKEVSGITPVGSTPSTTESDTQMKIENTSSTTLNGLNINELPIHVRKTFEEMTARLKHLEASIAVHDLANPGITSSQSHITSNTKNITPSFSNNSSSFPLLPPPSTFNVNFSPQGLYRNPSDLVNPFADDSRQPKYDFDPYVRIELFNYLPFFIKKTRLESHDPFSIISMMRKDPYLNVLWIHIWRTIETSQSLTAAKNVDGNSNEQVNSCIQYAIDQSKTGRDSGKGAARSMHSFFALRKDKIQKKIESKEVIESSKNLDEMILKILPTTRIMFLLSMRFFRYVYPFFPFIEENSFFGGLSEFASSFSISDIKITHLNINSKYDYASLGLVLLVLRLGYLSISEEELNSNKDFQPLRESPITPVFVDVATKCLEHYKFLRKSYSLKVIQLSLYILLYYRHCLEDDDISDGSGSSIMLGTVFSMAYSVGLNRDPSFLTGSTTSSSNQSQGEIWKKIWYKLLELDSSQALISGSVLRCHDDSSYDTPLPEVDPNNDEVDTFVVGDFALLYKRTKIYRQVTSICNNMRLPPTTLDVIKSVKLLESFAMELGCFKRILNDTSLKKYAMVKKLSYLTEARVSIFNFKASLFMHFESVGNMKKAFEYLDECLKLLAEISCSLMNTAYNETLYFGQGYSNFLQPVENLAISKCALFLVALHVRLLHSHRRLSQVISNSSAPSIADVSKLKMLKDFTDLLLTDLDTILQLLNKFAARSYNFSKVHMVLRLYHIQLDNPSFDFDEIANDVLAAAKGSTLSKLSKLVLHDLRSEKVPKSNIFDLLLEAELSHLMGNLKGDILTILTPVITVSTKRHNANSNSVPMGQTDSTPATVSSSGAQSSCDPFNPYNPPRSCKESKSQAPTPNSSINDSPSININRDNIFGFNTQEDSLNDPEMKLVTDPAAVSRLVAGDSFYGAGNLLTSEEYASLFGIFDEYNGAEDATQFMRM